MTQEKKGVQSRMTREKHTPMTKKKEEIKRTSYFNWKLSRSFDGHNMFVVIEMIVDCVYVDVCQ
jgi:hypothetical protein